MTGRRFHSLEDKGMAKKLKKAKKLAKTTPLKAGGPSFN